jgi:hypothetical protein
VSRTLVIREYDPQKEQSFLFDSWLRSLKPSRHTGPIPANLYWPTYRAVIEQLLERWGVQVIMAYDPDDEPPNDLYGYLVYEDGFDRPVVHYAYVKDEYRKKGVLKYMLKKAGIRSTYFTTFKTSDSTSYMKNGVWREEIAKKRKPEPLPGSIWHNKAIKTFTVDPKRKARREAAAKRKK